MKNATLSTRDLVMAALLLVLVIGVAYYMGFYAPMQEELAAIARDSAQIDEQIVSASSKIAVMNTMQSELDEIFARPAGEISEIAPYDNKEVVLRQLNGILQQSEEYSLNFAEPSIQEDGTVRRSVAMNFRCADFNAAKAIILDLTEGRWRCLVSNLSMSGSGDVMNGPVQVNATITFFESTKLNEPKRPTQ